MLDSMNQLMSHVVLFWKLYLFLMHLNGKRASCQQVVQTETKLLKLEVKHTFPPSICQSHNDPLSLKSKAKHTVCLLTSGHFMPVCATFLACQQVRNVKPNDTTR